MKRFIRVFIPLFLGVALSGVSSNSSAETTTEVTQESGEAKNLGTRLADFALTSHNGEFFQLYRNENARAVVLYSYGIGCPIARKNLPELRSIRKKYQEKNIRFFFIDSATQDSRKTLVDEAREYGIDFPILIDATQRIARSLQIDRTAQALVIDTKTWKVVYRGAIADKFNYDFETNKAEGSFLSDALEDIVNNRPVRRPQADTLGCAITFEKPLVTDYRHTIAPLMANRCARCHRALGIAPTNMWTYAEAKGWKSMIGEVVRTERMPPWEFDSYYTKLKYADSFTDYEKKLLYSWLETGTPEERKGAVVVKREKPPTVPSFKRTFSLKLAKTIEIPAETLTPWYYEEIEFKRDRDLLIKSFLPIFQNRRNLQHVALLVMKRPIDLSRNIFQPEYLQKNDILNIIRFSPSTLKPISGGGNRVYRIPKDAHLYVEMHFALTGKDEKQFLEIEIEEYRDRVKPAELIYDPLDVVNFVIPPNTESYKVYARRTVDRDIHILRMGPHMHWRGRSAKLSRILPGQVPGEPEKKEILGSWRFVFKNRTTWALQDPLFISVGTILEAEFEYDNSRANPARIEYNKSVRYGPDAFLQEMANMHLIYY